METAIVSLICIALIVFGGMTMSQGFLTSVDTTSVGLEEMSARGGEIMRTELSTVNSTMQSASNLFVRLENTGQTKMADFDKWDVIVQYYDSGGSYYVKWLPYTVGTLGDNEWEKSRIYIEGEAPEAFEPNIVNPGETIELEVQLNPAVGNGYTNQIVVSTPNGIPASTLFSR